MRSAAALSLSALREAMVTLAPASANACAVASPRPELPPMTKTFLLLKLGMKAPRKWLEHHLHAWRIKRE
jgi:hypothetical protein